MQTELLSGLFGSKLRAKVLGWLFTHTDERFFVRQLTALLNADSTNLSRELARLEKMGLLVSTISGKQKYYQANQKSPVFNELHSLMVKTAGVVDILRSALAPAGKLINTALIFGSVAGRTENRSSDIDILVVGDIPFGDVVSLLSPAQKILGREINPVVYSPEEFISRVTKEHYFVKNILDGLRIFIIGDNDVLDRLVKSRAIGKTQARLQ